MDKTVKYYMAPLESVTTWIYRQAHAKIYGRLDKYFIPFLEPHEKRDFKTRELQEILPEHNENIYVVPQILTNRSEGFIKLAKALKDWGYEEINLNLGCPSKTVVTKGKGSGFLAKPEELERFLTEIFDALSGEVKISVKTRIGKEDPDLYAIILYGSYARGDYNNNSDVDIMILVDLPETEIKKIENDVYDVAFEIEINTGINISPVIKNRAQFEYWVDTLPYYRNVRDEGITIKIDKKKMD